MRHLTTVLRSAAALAVLSVVAWAPQIAAALVAGGLTVLLTTREGLSPAEGLPILGIGLLGSLSVGLACVLRAPDDD